MEPFVEYDGHRFDISGMTFYMTPLFFIAKKARAGDSDAIEFCRALEVVIRDVDGMLYYDWKKGTDNGQA